MRKLPRISPSAGGMKCRDDNGASIFIAVKKKTINSVLVSTSQVNKVRYVVVPHSAVRLNV